MSVNEILEVLLLLSNAERQALFFIFGAQTFFKATFPSTIYLSKGIATTTAKCPQANNNLSPSSPCSRTGEPFSESTLTSINHHSEVTNAYYTIYSKQPFGPSLLCSQSSVMLRSVCTVEQKTSRWIVNRITVGKTSYERFADYRVAAVLGAKRVRMELMVFIQSMRSVSTFSVVWASLFVSKFRQ